jgi:cob(I)alamin adenosyltransferase
MLSYEVLAWIRGTPSPNKETFIFTINGALFQVFRKAMNPHRTNRVILLTGDGKGKTSSALGMALRAAGHGLRVSVVQFIKQRTDTGEARALRLLPGVEHRVCGQGFVRERAGAAFEAHAQAARDGLALAAERLRDPACGMVVLDEVCGAVSLGLLDARAVAEALAAAAPGTIAVLTGRDAPPELAALADTVSVVTCVKHAYEQGRPAQRGVEW